MALLDASFAREATKFIGRADKHHPDLVPLVTSGEVPICVEKVIEVPPGNRHGMFLVTDRAWYTASQNGGGWWTRTQWESIKTLLVSSGDGGAHISLIAALHEDGPGVDRCRNGRREHLSPTEVASAVLAGDVVLDAYLFNNSTHLKSVLAQATRRGAEVRNDGVPPQMLPR